jgi:hypothetical protein
VGCSEDGGCVGEVAAKTYNENREGASVGKNQIKGEVERMYEGAVKGVVG